MRAIFLFALLLSWPDKLLLAQEPNQPSSRLDRSEIGRVGQLPTDQRIDTLERSLKSAPGNVQMQIALGSAFLQKMRETTDFQYLRRASALAESVLRDHPDSYAARRLTLEIEMHKHEFPKVAEAAEQLLATNPSDTGVLGLRGDALMEMGKYDEAGETYKHMVSLGPNLFSYNRLAFFLFITGDMELALAWMAHAVDAGSPSSDNQAWVLCEMGDLLSKAGRIPNAEYAYRNAMKAFPGYHRAHAGLGRLQAARGEWSAAIASFQQAQAVVPLPEYAAMLEALYGKTGNAQAATRERVMVDAVDKLMASNDEKANRALVLIYANSGRNLSRALELARAEFAVRNDVYSWDALSWALLKNKRVEEAREASAKALARRTPDPMLYFHAGMIALASEHKEDAQIFLTKALALNPQFDFRDAPLAKAELRKLSGPAEDNAR